MDVQCDLVLLSDSVINATDGKISAIGIFDRVEARSLPFILESAMHVVRLKGTAGREIRLHQKMVSPAGDEMASVDTECKLDGFGVMNVISGIKNILLDKEGKYEFQAFCGETLIATTTLDMVLIQSAKEPGD